MKVALVGSCGSGKTTIAEAMREHGFETYVVGQEHSAVANLWARRQPDALVYLDATLLAIRQRRSPEWPEWLYHQQQQRLQAARESASVIVDTSEIGVEETVNRIRKVLEQES